MRRACISGELCIPVLPSRARLAFKQTTGADPLLLLLLLLLLQRACSVRSMPALCAVCLAGEQRARPVTGLIFLLPSRGSMGWVHAHTSVPQHVHSWAHIVIAKFFVMGKGSPCHGESPPAPG